MNDLATIALRLAAEKNLAYVVLPTEDEDHAPLAVPGAKDCSEHEFARTVFAPGVLAAMVRQCRGRIVDAVALRALCCGASLMSKDYQIKELGRLHKALELAAEFVGEMRGEIEYGSSEFGWGSGRGVAATIRAVKRAERLVGQVLDMVDRPRGSDQRDPADEARIGRFREILTAAMVPAPAEGGPR